MAGPLGDVAFVLRLALGVLRLIAGALVGALRVVLVLYGIVKSLRLLRRGLTCPRGHEVPTEGAVYACAGCGYTYEGGSQWLCPNPECGASTPYVNCPTCGLSVTSPYRFHH